MTSPKLLLETGETTVRHLARTVSTFVGMTLVVSFGNVGTSTAGPPQYESAQIHPLDRVGEQVLAVNTPDSRLSIFAWTDDGLVLQREVKVGMEPVTVRAKSPVEAWVVNHLSDDVSIVDTESGLVLATISVGDEPTDVAFVLDPIDNDGSLWAAICLSQEDRIVFLDAEPPYAEMGSVEIPGSDPRALAVSPARDAVWVSVFESGNNTTIIGRPDVNDPSSPWNGNLPPMVPELNPDLPASLLPDNTVIVRKSNGFWLDEQGGDWSDFVSWDLYDIDLVRIDVNPTPTIGRTVTEVGTLIEDIVVGSDGRVWAINLEAKSEIYFEEKLRGEFIRNRITEIDDAGVVTSHSLNSHIDFGQPGTPNPASSPAAREESISSPTEVVVSNVSGMDEIYVTAIGSERIAVVSPLSGETVRRISVQEGATGLVAHPDRGRLVLLDRLRNELAIVDPIGGETGERFPIGRTGWDPTDPNVKNGRQFLYTGSRSAHGTVSCASCHPSANMDNLAWDLGDPTGELSQLLPEDNGGIEVSPFHPLKGPMTTQTLRGLKDSGRLHWRGDRADVGSFNPAFVSLLGGDSLNVGENQDFETFVLSLEYPPNPHRNILDQMGEVGNGGNPDLGKAVFEQNGFCIGCHALPLGTTGQVFPLENIEGFGNQPLKIPQLRNLYEKTGFDDRNGPNKRGFGYLHDGQDHDLIEFVSEPIFNLDESLKPHLVSFLMNFPTGTHPATGVAVTFEATNVNDPNLLSRYTDLISVTEDGSVDLVVSIRMDGIDRGLVWTSNSPSPTFQSDRAGEVYQQNDLLDAVVDGAIITFMAVPLGEGVRMGIDRDLDGALDRDELDAGSDPANPDNVPTGVDPWGTDELQELARFVSVFPAPFVREATVEFYLPTAQEVRVDVFNVDGRRVISLADGYFQAGRQQVVWSGDNREGRAVPAGSYFLQLRTDGATDARKVIRLD